MNNEFTIRLGKPDDIQQIAEVYADSISQLCKDDYDPEVIAHWAESTPPESRLPAIETESLWVAEVNHRIAGYLVSIPGELVALFIGSKYAGLGIGRALGQLGINVAKRNNSAKVILEATITAAPFYKRLGFTEVSRGDFSHGQTDLRIPVVNMIFKEEVATIH